MKTASPDIQNISSPYRLPFERDELGACLDKFRARRPHVHCITNSVAQHFTANVLLAAGATPSMTIAEEEIADFTKMADALLINLGTMDKQRTEAVGLALETASVEGKPWALDPVFVQASPLRLAFAQTLLGQNPTLVRSNAGEANALFNEAVSSKNAPQMAGRFGGILVLTGKIDVISNKSGALSGQNGHPAMDRVTAMGCALTALMIGFCAVEKDQMLAAATSLSLFGLAGEKAAQKAEGPGTFVPHFLDALSTLSEEDLNTGAKITP